MNSIKHGLVKLFIASSIDGYIARKNGAIDWLENVQMPEEGDYGYEALMHSCDSIIMGCKTYEFLIQSGIDWPYTNYKTYVISRNQKYTATTPSTQIINKLDEVEFQKIKSFAQKSIWLVGGSEIIQIFNNNNWIDEITHTIVPIMLGEGIPLFLPHQNHSNWNCIDVKLFSTGLVNIIYQKQVESSTHIF